MKATPKVQVASMLRNTMLNLKQRKGVSLAQIRKHLEANYTTKLNMTNKKRLATALKSLVQTGKVAKTPAGVYKLKKTAEGDEGEVPNRRRRTFPKGYCKTHRHYHRSHRRSRRRRRSHRRRRSRHRRRRSRRRRKFPRGYCKTHRHYHRKRR